MNHENMRQRLQWMADEIFEFEDLKKSEEPEERDLDLELELDDIIGEVLREEEEPHLRNRAAHFDRMAFADEDFDESIAVTVSCGKDKQERRKGAGGLVLLAILEIIAIVAVLLRWALWFL